jgi:hypothetical protein
MYRFNPRALVLVFLAMFLFGYCAASAHAQTLDVDNPTAVEFTASTDHALIDGYEVDILRPDGSVLQTINAGKPAPDATNVVRVTLNVQPIAFAAGYTVRARAVAGTAVSPYSVSVNKFNRVPGGPSKVILR